MAKVTCVGIAIMDLVFGVENLPTGTGKQFATEFLEIGGGPAATAAVAVSRLGAECDLWSRVGDDATGDKIIDEISAYGVGTSFVRKLVGAKSTLAAVIVDSAGERAIVSYTDPALIQDPSWLPTDKLAGTGCVLADCRWVAAVKEVFPKANKLGVPTLLDGDLTPDKAVCELAPLASHVVFSQGGLTQFTGIEDPDESLKVASSKLDGWVCVTLGDKGSRWVENGEVVSDPGFRVDVIDTVGAGDVFHGAFAVALAEGMSGRPAVRFASAAAALKCTRFGGRAGIPDRADVEDFLQSH
jgi:sulfofructose kinase